MLGTRWSARQKTWGKVWLAMGCLDSWDGFLVGKKDNQSCVSAPCARGAVPADVSLPAAYCLASSWWWWSFHATNKGYCSVAVLRAAVIAAAAAAAASRSRPGRSASSLRQGALRTGLPAIASIDLSRLNCNSGGVVRCALRLVFGGHGQGVAAVSSQQSAAAAAAVSAAGIRVRHSRMLQALASMIRRFRAQRKDAEQSPRSTVCTICACGVGVLT